jgi:thiamine pyrophosphokinase
MTGVVLCGGRITDYEALKKYLKGAELVISADSGARHCRNFGLVPDLLVGDFDSVSEADYAGLVSAGVEIARFPVEKDMTDSELALEIAIEKGCRRVILLGALGTRLDHSLSNVFLLKKLLDSGVEGILADENNEARLINDKIELDREEDRYLTLLPFAGDAEGVTIQGFYYPLENATLKVGSSWGVSNRFASGRAVVTVRKGCLLVLLSKD